MTVQFGKTLENNSPVDFCTAFENFKQIYDA